MKRNIYEENEYLAPHFAIARMNSIIRKNGAENAITKNSYRRERELWIGSLFCLGLHKESTKEYWLRSPEDDPPDIEVITFADKNGKKVRELQKIEIVEHELHGNGILSTIEKKLNTNQFQKEDRLLCYAHSTPGLAITPIELFNEVQKLNPKLLEIWILFSDTNQRYYLIRLHPEIIRISFPERDILKYKNQTDIIKVSRGTTKSLETNKTKFIKLP